MTDQGEMADDLAAAAVAAEEAAAEAAVAAEQARWAAVDLNDPQAVIRALAEVGMRAGVKASLAEHMHDRIGRALGAFQEATAALATREDVDRRIKALEDDFERRRARDRKVSGRRFVGLVVVGVLFAAVVVSAIILNRLDLERDNDEDRRIALRTEAVAICASTHPGDREAIRACVTDELADLGVPSRP